MDARLEELIQRAADGALTTEESAELERWLAEEPGARAYRHRLEEVVRQLEEVGAAEPPPDLHREILEAIQRRENARKSAVATHRSRRLPRRRDLLPFAAGLAAGVALFALLGRGDGPVPSTDPDRMAGTMRPGARSAETTSAEGRRIEGPGLVATALLRIEGERTEVELRLRSDHPVEAVLEPEGTLTPLFGERRGPSAGEIRLDDGACRVLHEGEGGYRFVLTAQRPTADTRLRLRLRSGTWSREISLIPGGAGDP
jgi:hypothetical protein